MPELFYGTLPEGTKRRLYRGTPLQQIESSLFDRWKIKKLAPRCRRPNLALLWWFRSAPHTALSWYDDRGKEQTILVPLNLPQTSVLPLSRELFGDLIPSAIVFRVLNERRPYLYD